MLLPKRFEVLVEVEANLWDWRNRVSRPEHTFDRMTMSLERSEQLLASA